MGVERKLLGALFVLLCIAALCALSYQWGSSNAFLQAEKDQRKALAKAEAVAAKKEAELKEKINAKVIELSKARQAQQKKTVEIIKKVPVYVTKIQREHSVCNLTRGTVCLLNSAVQDANQCDTDLTSSEAKEPSSITEQALIETVHDYIAEYNALAQRCATLIDVVEVIQEDNKP